MKVQLALMGVLLCLAVRAADTKSQDSPTNKPAPVTKQLLTGCVDEQFGKYVLLDNQMAKIATLQSAGAEKDVFAKFVGHKVQLTGTKSEGQNAMFTVSGIENLADNCSQAAK